jgi:hypothetical protein
VDVAQSEFSPPFWQIKSSRSINCGIFGKSPMIAQDRTLLVHAKQPQSRPFPQSDEDKGLKIFLIISPALFFYMVFVH